MKKTHTRRETAFHRLGILLVLFAIGSFTGLYQVLPSMAMRNLEIGNGIAPTQTIDWVYNPGLSNTTLYYLQENEDVLLWASVNFHPILGGWQRQFASVVELEESLPLQVSFESISKGDQSIVYAFGQVNQEGTVVLQARDWEDDSLLCEFVVETYINHQGKTYFIADITDFYMELYHPKFMYHLRTPEGNVVGDAQLDGSHTYIS